MIFKEITDAITLVESDGAGLILTDVQSALDLLGAVWGRGECKKIILKKGDIAEEFFDLKTKIAGESLQKFVNYGFQIAIVGDFSGYTSKSLKDFIFESNKGRSVHFASTLEEAVDFLRA